MSGLSNSQKEELRAEVLVVLAAASPLAFPADVVRRRVTQGKMLNFEPDVREVEAALELLIGLKLAQKEPASLGSTLHYQVTAAGVLHVERGGV